MLLAYCGLIFDFHNGISHSGEAWFQYSYDLGKSATFGRESVGAYCVDHGSSFSIPCAKLWGSCRGSRPVPFIYQSGVLHAVTGFTGSEITLSDRVLYFRNLKKFIDIYYLGEERHICLS